MSQLQVSDLTQQSFRNLAQASPPICATSCLATIPMKCQFFSCWAFLHCSIEWASTRCCSAATRLARLQWGDNLRSWWLWVYHIDETLKHDIQSKTAWTMSGRTLLTPHRPSIENVHVLDEELLPRTIRYTLISMLDGLLHGIVWRLDEIGTSTRGEMSLSASQGITLGLESCKLLWRRERGWSLWMATS